MTAVTAAWSAVWILVAAVVGIRLWRMSTTFKPPMGGSGGSSPRTSTVGGSRGSFPLTSTVGSGYRWLAVAALCLGVGGTIQLTLGGLIGGALPLRVADLISLAALPALVIGVASAVSDHTGGDRVTLPTPRPAGRGPRRSVGTDDPVAHGSRWSVTFRGQIELSRWRRSQDGSILAKVGTAVVLDSALLVVSLFAIGLVVMFGADYTRSGVAPATFTLDLIRPLADLAALGLILMLAPRHPRRTVFVVLALIAVTIADSLAVGSRSLGDQPGTAAHLALLAGIALLAAAPLARPAGVKADELAQARSWWLTGVWSTQARMAAPVAAAAAALVIAGFAVFGHPVATSAVAVTAAIGVILLVLRLGWSAKHASTVKLSAQASDWVLSALVDSTSDTVLICDRSGLIEYVSDGSVEFGYGQGTLPGTQLADIVHPEDRPAGVRAAMRALRSASGTAVFVGRARSADGSWRQVKATLARYGQPGEPAKLLITCHDDSELFALRRQVTQLTFHDGLTGLPNRAYLENRVKGLSRSGGQHGVVAAILVGLDGYSMVLDLGGQPGENLVLAQAGRRLRAAAPPGAIVARWGSDQFAILITDSGATGTETANLAQLTEFADRLSHAISAEPFAMSAKEVRLTASVGVAMSSVADAADVLGNANYAMSKAAEAGGGRIEVFGAQMRAMARRQVELTAALDKAIADHELTIEYLPVVELATSAVKCVEAVATWRVASESVSAGELFSVADGSGLIVRLGDWMLRAASRELAGWRGADQAGHSAPGLALRVSAKQLGAPNFVGSVLRILDEAGLPPQALTLEIDERVLINAAGSMRVELADLRRQGIKLAIDRYGTGYTSLSYLRELAVDAIKIDSSLVAGLGSDPTLTLLTSTIAGLGRDLGIDTIAAGVDRPDQAELLQAMGCRLGQGSWLTNRLAAVAVAPLPAGPAASWIGQSAEGPVGQPEDRSPDQAGDPACSSAN